MHQSNSVPPISTVCQAGTHELLDGLLALLADAQDGGKIDTRTAPASDQVVSSGDELAVHLSKITLAAPAGEHEISSWDADEAEIAIATMAVNEAEISSSGADELDIAVATIAIDELS